MTKSLRYTAVLLSVMLGGCSGKPSALLTAPRPLAAPIVAGVAKPTVIKPAPALKTGTPAAVAKAETAAALTDSGVTASAADVADAENFFAQALAAAEEAPEPTASAAPVPDPDGLPDFIVSPDPKTNDTELYFDDGQIFPELTRMLRSAEKRIQISYYLLGGDIGMNLAKVIAERQAAGVDVQIMLDPTLGTAGATAAGIARVIAYLDSQNVSYRMYPLALFGPMPNAIQKKFQINHNKVCVVDGETAFIGSMNLDDLARVNHDLMVRIKGPSAVDLSEMLDEEWKFGIAAGATAPATAMTTQAVGQVRLSQTAPQEKTTKELLLQSFRDADHSIHVTMYEFGDAEIAAGLVEAFQRGVDVRVLLDPKAKNLKKYGASALPDGMPNVLPARELLKAGAQVHWFKPWRNDQELHMKAVVIDEKKLIAGSTNWTTNAFTRFRETSFVVEGDTAAAFETEFERMWTQTSTNVEKLTWKQLLTARLTEYLNRKDYAFW